MAFTYEPIATNTLGSASSTITFNSIPQTYTHLRLVLVATSANNPNPYVRFNSDSGTNYSQTWLRGNGSSASSSRETTQNRWWLYPAILSTPFLFNIDVFNYTNTSVFKSSLAAASGDNNGSGDVYRTVSLWRSTSAVTSLSLNIDTFTFAAGSQATLFGIKAA